MINKDHDSHSRLPLQHILVRQPPPDPLARAQYEHTLLLHRLLPLVRTISCSLGEQYIPLRWFWGDKRCQDKEREEGEDGGGEEVRGEERKGEGCGGDGHRFGRCKVILERK